LDIGTQQFASEALQEDDLRLVADILAKDRKATAEFVERYSGTVYAFVRRRLLYRPEAVDDVVQEVFLAAWRALAHFRGESHLKSWLLGIARHKLDDYHRGRARELAWPGDAGGDKVADLSSETLEAQFDRATERDKLRRVLQEIPEHYRLVLVLRYLEELSLREIGEITDRTEKAVERLLARARDQFRERWIHGESR